MFPSFPMVCSTPSPLHSLARVVSDHLFSFPLLVLLISICFPSPWSADSILSPTFGSFVFRVHNPNFPLYHKQRTCKSFLTVPPPPYVVLCLPPTSTHLRELTPIPTRIALQRFQFCVSPPYKRFPCLPLRPSLACTLISVWQPSALPRVICPQPSQGQFLAYYSFKRPSEFFDVNNLREFFLIRKGPPFFIFSDVLL